jgi:hypothetical protein
MKGRKSAGAPDISEVQTRFENWRQTRNREGFLATPLTRPKLCCGRDPMPRVSTQDQQTIPHAAWCPAGLPTI